MTSVTGLLVRLYVDPDTTLKELCEPNGGYTRPKKDTLGDTYVTKTMGDGIVVRLTRIKDKPNAVIDIERSDKRPMSPEDAAHYFQIVLSDLGFAGLL